MPLWSCGRGFTRKAGSSHQRWHHAQFPTWRLFYHDFHIRQFYLRTVVSPVLIEYCYHHKSSSSSSSYTHTLPGSRLCLLTIALDLYFGWRFYTWLYRWPWWSDEPWETHYNEEMRTHSTHPFFDQLADFLHNDRLVVELTKIYLYTYINQNIYLNKFTFTLRLCRLVSPMPADHDQQTSQSKLYRID